LIGRSPTAVHTPRTPPETSGYRSIVSVSKYTRSHTSVSPSKMKKAFMREPGHWFGEVSLLETCRSCSAGRARA
jgi:uncharacterized protein (DUF488 family)